MIDADERNRICDEIEALFKDLTVDDVAQILSVQVLRLTVSASENKTEALDFLDEIRGDVADYLDDIDFDAVRDAEEDDGEEEAIERTAN